MRIPSRRYRYTLLSTWKKYPHRLFLVRLSRRHRLFQLSTVLSAIFPPTQSIHSRRGLCPCSTLHLPLRSNRWSPVVRARLETSELLLSIPRKLLNLDLIGAAHGRRVRIRSSWHSSPGKVHQTGFESPRVSALAVQSNAGKDITRT